MADLARINSAPVHGFGKLGGFDLRDVRAMNGVNVIGNKLALPAIDVDGNWIWNNSYRPTTRTATSFAYTGGGYHGNQGFRWEPAQPGIYGGFLDATLLIATDIHCECNIFSLYDRAQANVHTASYYDTGSWFGHAGYLNSGNFSIGAVTNQYGERASPILFGVDDFALSNGDMQYGKRFRFSWFNAFMTVTCVDTGLSASYVQPDGYVPDSIFFGHAIYNGAVSMAIHDFYFLYW